MTRGNWIAIGGFVLCALLILVTMRYQITPAGYVSYRLDRLTGQVQICTAGGCRVLPRY